MKFAFIIGLVVFVTGPAMASKLTLEQVQKALSTSRSAYWIAGENHITQRDEKDQKKMLGLKLESTTGEYAASMEHNRGSFPASLDWRNVNGVNFVGPMLNQGSCGSCVAFASVTAVETQLNITRKTSNSPWALSPQYLFGCGGGMCEKGWQLYQAADFLKSTGVPDEACMPYTSGSTGEDVACKAACSDAKSRSILISNYAAPTFFFVDKDKLKEALQKGPVMAAMYVYEDFLFYKSGVYKHVTGKMAGGHAVTIVGWNDADNAWIVKNSWSNNWGEQGYFRIDYDDASALGFQSMAFEVPEANGYVSTGSLRDYIVFRGAVSVNAESTYPGTSGLEWKMDQNHETVDWGRIGRSKAITIDTTKYSDGVYQLQVAAQHGSDVTLSPPRRIYILNGKFSGSLSFVNLKNGDTVTEQKKIEVGLQSSPVPFTRIVLTVKSLETGEVTVRTSDNPTSKLLMVWRAQLLKNGDYELKLEGQVGDYEKVQAEPIRVTVNHS